MVHFPLCHPATRSRDPVKNTNNISIFSCFLDTVAKPRYDTERVFQAI
nr:palindromic element RPE4 domain-containing protein [Rickettsia monacensis]